MPDCARISTPKFHAKFVCAVSVYMNQDVNCNGFSTRALHGLHATGQGSVALFSHERFVIIPGPAHPPAAAPERCADGDEPAHSVERWRWRRVLFEVALLDSLL